MTQGPTVHIGDAPLTTVDPELAALLRLELARQQATLDMIASENLAPRAVLECQGSVLTNKYAEGYPGRRYYGGCEIVDESEQLAIDRAKKLFGGDHVNVQPHSGAQANAAVYHALLKPSDRILGLELSHGGHLTHGMKINVSGRLYDAIPYHVRKSDGWIDMDEVEALAREHSPKLVIAGWSAYPRHLDFAAFRQIAYDAGALLMVDMAHFAGLVAAGVHPNPVPFADVVTTTTHKTLGGPRGGMIICRQEFARAIDSAVFPGQQGGPLEHVIAAKAAALGIAATDSFRARQWRTIEGAQILAETLAARVPDAAIQTGGTDVHLVLADLQRTPVDGRQAEDRLAGIGITANRNAIPFDPRPPMVASGLRLGTASLATRGFDHDDFSQLADIVADSLRDPHGSAGQLAERVAALAQRRPIYRSLTSPAKEVPELARVADGT